MTLWGKIKSINLVKLGFLTLLATYLFIFVLMSGSVLAIGQLTNRSLTLLPGATDGGSKPSGTVKHQFDFTIATTNSVGSIIFQYCTTATGSCTGPTGLDVDGVTLDNQSGTGATGFAVNAT